jgi:GDPmannose 4,6-dehydratase
VRAMWLMLQQKKPDDYVIATGESHSVREFVEMAFREIGVEIQWKGKGAKEVGVISEVRGQRSEVGGQDQAVRAGDVVVEVDRRYFRPTEVDELLGDSSKARKSLGWEPKISFQEMISAMVKADVEEASRDQFCKDQGFKVLNFNE